ncbi:hypothetical protein SNEBB_010915 [Seison nebaliae]|nr:hypothetical protein SNEBB_010915 [Seison nebaliae]
MGIARSTLTLRILEIGDAASGKTALLQQFLTGKTNETYTPTAGIEFNHLRLIVRGRNCKVQVWDPSGTAKHRSMLDTYYSGIMGYVLVIDRTKLASIKTLHSWIERIHEQVGKDKFNRTVKVVMLTKTDLKPEEVTEAELFCDRYNISVIIKGSSLTYKKGDTKNPIYVTIEMIVQQHECIAMCKKYYMSDKCCLAR